MEAKMKAGIKDEQKSKALQVCRMLIDAYDSNPGSALWLAEVDAAFRAAREVITVSGPSASFRIKP